MQKIIFVLFCIFLSRPVLANSFLTTIDSITSEDDGTQLIFFANGRVAFLEKEDRSWLVSLVRSKKNDEWLVVDLDEQLRLHSVYTYSQEWGEQTENTTEYTPTFLKDQSEAHKIYGRMRTDYQEDAQCYHMAHVWAYEEHKRSGLNSMKQFLFFTKQYIRQYRYGWWYHVAPMVMVLEKNKSIPLVLDRRYTTMPFDIKTWTEHFILSGKACKTIAKIKTFYNYRGSEEHCFLMDVSMYYVLPYDIRKRDETGREKTKFYKRELDFAYRAAF